MPVYIVQGKLGTGKGKFVMGKMQEALVQGRRVATNMDLWLENLPDLSQHSRATVIRLPDKPTAADLDAAGPGYEGYDESKNGVLVLDELGSWFNARTFQDKNRAALIDWLIHSRKKGWDCYLIVQNVDMVDKQLRVALAEYLVKCIRADRIKIPIIGGLLGKRGRLPRMHIAQYSMTDVPGIQIDREFYRGDDLQEAYDTKQIFREWVREPGQDGFHAETYMGPFSYLTPWHIKGRHAVEQPRKSFLARFFRPATRPALKPKLPLVQRLEKLDPDKAWFYARQLCQQGVH